ncbi:sterol 3-beta-glucosyltransferase UGT80B1 isoform X2 [Euphorbia lathyris]|uniref:sterol 3-beta-glucosyltransferase UGT80B1 isoform X2 n=1 Tax=Euphorbia lathyris TaxID=212925 RepID=UPI003313DAD7
METERTEPVALFMAFGTKGDVYPIAAIAAAFACDQKQYHVFLLTHSAHESLRSHLEDRHVNFLPIKSPPVLAIFENHDSTDSPESAFSHHKRIISRAHRRECHYVVEGIFGHRATVEGDFIVINFFALEGWCLAELFRVRCVVAAPYVIPYSAPLSFECQFKREFPVLYEYLQEAPVNKVCWKDVMHWMWPLFTEIWGSWRSDDLNLSPCPLTDPVTGLPTWHEWPLSPLLLYGFSKEIVECPDYWPPNVRVCGFWFLPVEWKFSCKTCGDFSALFPCGTGSSGKRVGLCAAHVKLECFLTASVPPVFVGLSSAGSMGFLKHPQAFVRVIQTVLEITSFRFIIFTSGYEPLDDALRASATETSLVDKKQYSEEGICLFDGRLFVFPGMIPYNWLFPRCAAAVHHGGSGSTAAALSAGIPQVICPFLFDQFYWAEKMSWLGVAPEPVKRVHLAPDKMDDMSIRVAANMLTKSIKDALSSEVKSRALEIAHRISLEDGVMEAVKVLKQEMDCSS